MEQLLLHLAGDYLLQSHWMATNKTKSWWPAFTHAFVYALLFGFIGSFTAVLVIGISHYYIDRYRLARYVIWFKNGLLNLDPFARQHDWKDCEQTGFPSDTPIWLSVWLLIITDNCIRLMINFFALKYL